MSLKHKMPHTGCYRGKTVHVTLRNGMTIIDKFYERNDRYIFLKESGKIHKADISAFKIYKPTQIFT